MLGILACLLYIAGRNWDDFAVEHGKVTMQDMGFTCHRVGSPTALSLVKRMTPKQETARNSTRRVGARMIR